MKTYIILRQYGPYVRAVMFDQRGDQMTRVRVAHTDEEAAALVTRSARHALSRSTTPPTVVGVDDPIPVALRQAFGRIWGRHYDGRRSDDRVDQRALRELPEPQLVDGAGPAGA